MGKLSLNKFFAICILLLSTCTAHAQDYTIRSFEFPNVYYLNRRLFVEGKDVWFGLAQGAYRMVDGNPKLVYSASNGLVVDSVRQITRDALGNYWFFSGDGVSIKTGSSWKYLWRNAHNWLGNMKSIDDHVWLTVPNSYQIIKYTSAAEDSTVFTTPEYIRDIEPAGDGTYWLAGYNGVYSFDEEKFAVDTAFWGVEDLLVAHDGTLFHAANTYVGLVFTRNKTTGNYTKLNIPYNDIGRIHQIEEDSNHVLYFATDAGLLIYNSETKQWRRINTALGLPSDFVRDVKVDSEGNVWMAMDTDGLKDRITAIVYDPSNDLSIVHGKIYDDKNLNGSQDEGEAGLADQFIRLGTSDSYAISSSDGSFTLQPVEGANTISWIDNAQWDAGVTPVTYQFNAPQDNSSYFQFGLKRNIVTDGSVNVTGTATRRGFDTYYYLTVKNEGTEPFVPQVIMEFDPSLKLVQSTPEVTAASGNQLRWSRPSLKGFSNETIRLHFTVLATVPLGDTLKNRVILEGLPQETDVVDNTDTLKQIVTGSFDPNDKLVKEGILAERYVRIGDKLTYTVRFQNTGTDTAFVVKIKDELDPSLELTSLRLLSASHAMQYTLHQRTIAFIFNNIKLPDSTRNEPASHGYVKFEIAPIATMQSETTVANTALIYFDFNEPVQTNIVTNRFVDVLPSDRVTGIEGDVAREVKLYPNPVSDFLMIRGEDQTMLKKAEIYTLTGTLITSSVLYNNSTEIDLANIDAGLYIVKVYGVNTYIRKILVVPSR